MIKKYLQFLNEADELATPPAQPTAQPAAQPPVQPAQSGSTETPEAAPQAQSGTTQGESGEQKPGDLSNYNNESVTKFPDTVKKMVDLLKDMDKEQLVKVRTLIAELKGIGDAKTEIGKL